MPYFAEQAEKVLDGLDYLILVGTKAPVTFFAYPGKSSELTPGNCEAISLATPNENIINALQSVVD